MGRFRTASFFLERLVTLRERRPIKKRMVWRFFLQSYVNWVQLHRKTVEKIFLLAINAFFKFEKSEFLFFQESSK
jgi:hypothetical protein